MNLTSTNVSSTETLARAVPKKTHEYSPWFPSCLETKRVGQRTTLLTVYFQVYTVPTPRRYRRSEGGARVLLQGLITLGRAIDRPLTPAYLHIFGRLSLASYRMFSRAIGVGNLPVLKKKKKKKRNDRTQPTPCEFGASNPFSAGVPFCWGQGAWK